MNPLGESPSNANANPWKTVSSRDVYENAWIRVREDQVIRPDQTPGIYGVVHFKNRAVGVLPVETNGDVWLIGQYRYPLDLYSWEIPEGGCPDGEAADECARRELQEETGLIAGSLEPLVTAHLSNSVSDEWGIVFRATELRAGPSAPEGCEQLLVARVPFAEALARVERGEITDSLSVIAILHEAVRRLRPANAARTLTLSPLEARFAILRLNADQVVPAWASVGDVWFQSRTDSELTLVAPEGVVPSEIEASRGWAGLKLEGPFPLNECGVLASLLNPLADAGVPIFALSTFGTDYVFIKECDYALAREALAHAGHRVRGMVNG